MSSSSPPPNPPVAIGEVLAGKFRVERILGAGGMGVVVAARHLELDERVAVKFLLADALVSPEAAARFVREARAAVKIKSEHVARVIDVGRMEDGSPYIVMEYLEGTDLSGRIAQGIVPIDDAVDYVLQACDAMAEAHALGIVHRDLKPANLFLTQRNDGSAVVKVLDFGISKVNVPDMSEAHLTKTSAVMGSPYYMSPEQMKSSRDVDGRSDVWALGVILYELLAGRPPFLGETLPELLSAIMLDVPPLMSDLRPEVSPELSAILQRVLQKDRTQRYQNVGELASALAPFAPRRSRYTLERVIKLSGTASLPSSRSAGASAAPAAVGAVTATAGKSTVVTPHPTQGAGTDSTWVESKPQPKSGRLGFVVGLVAVIAVAGGGGALLAMRPQAPPTEQLPPAAAAPPAPAPVAPAVPAVVPALAAEPPAPAPAVASAPPAASAPEPAAAAAPAPAAKPAPVARAASKPARAAEKPSTPGPSPMVTPAPAPAPAATPAKRSGLQIDLK